ETSLSKYDEEEQNILYFNDLFLFNIIYPNDKKSDKDNGDNEIDTIQSSGGNENTQRMLFNLIKNLYVPFGIPFDHKRYYKDDMDLPPHDRRHLWLRYQVEGYAEEIVHDFEQRLKTIFSRQVNQVHILDFEGLTLDMRQGQSPEKVTATDLFYLRSMDRGAANLSYLLAKYLFRHAEIRKNDARLFREHFIGLLSHHFGLVSDDGLRGLFVVTREIPLIDMERQQVAAAGAPEATEDALAVDEGAQADPAPVQAPQPPPPPLVAGRTVRILRGLVEKSVTDQGRFSTWMIGYMTQLMDASGQTYQAFDGTF
nr:hypothetical protein [Tanacetum cinerariifolium]